MEWINIKEKQPKIGLEVNVKTIYGFNDTGIWDGAKWLNSEGEFKGEVDEAPQWSSKVMANKNQLNKTT
jgi:hypothetical protein